jgi:capsule polysaccharide export protein KpsE/RkpR
LINNQISEYKQLNSGALTDTSRLTDAKDLAALRAELLLRSATYSDEHPDIRALKRKIEALDKSMAATNPKAKADESAKSTVAINTSSIGIDTLETQRIGLREELNRASQKYSAARLGENMERAQQSERLEVIEQPTLPQSSTKPNKPKLFALVFGFAFVFGGGLVVAAEALDRSIRRSADLFALVDSQLVVAIPYISTKRETLRHKNKTILVVGISMAVVLAGLVTLFFILPPLDVLLDSLIARLSR